MTRRNILSALALVLAALPAAPAAAQPADQLRLIVWPTPTSVSTSPPISATTPTPQPGQTPVPAPRTATPTATTNVYPLADATQVRARGDRTITTRPLKTTRAPDGRLAVADRIVVGFEPGIQVASVHDMARVKGAGLVNPVRSLGAQTQVVDVSGSGTLDRALAAYRGTPGVRFAEPDFVYHLSEVPNDPQFSLQWGMSKIQAPAAWDATHGSSSRLIAIVDSGIYDEASTFPSPDGLPGHPDLRGKVAVDVNLSSESGTDDNNGHGTHVAGIAAASTNNGLGVAGVGYSTRLLNVKVFDMSGSAPESAVNSGIRWAADHGASVINLSLGAPGSCSAAAQDAIDYAWARNAVIVVAAGNAGTSNLQTPASCNHVIAVASTDGSDAKSSFSTYGSWVQVAAPGGTDQNGHGILSTSNAGDYVYQSGTSMAAPHVSGLAALVWETRFGTSNDAVVKRIQSTADQISGTGSYWTYGRVNAFAAVSGVVCTPRPAVSVSASPAGAGSLQVTVTVSGVNNTLVSLQFGNPSSSPASPFNALIDAGAQTGQTGNFSVTVPAGTTQTTFTVRRSTPGMPTTVPMIVTDGCGTWPTLVGGGPTAF